MAVKFITDLPLENASSVYSSASTYIGMVVIEGDRNAKTLTIEDFKKIYRDIDPNEARQHAIPFEGFYSPSAFKGINARDMYVQNGISVFLGSYTPEGRGDGAGKGSKFEGFVARGSKLSFDPSVPSGLSRPQMNDVSLYGDRDQYSKLSYSKAFVVGVKYSQGKSFYSLDDMQESDKWIYPNDIFIALDADYNTDYGSSHGTYAGGDVVISASRDIVLRAGKREGSEGALNLENIKNIKFKSGVVAENAPWGDGTHSGGLGDEAELRVLTLKDNAIINFPLQDNTTATGTIPSWWKSTGGTGGVVNWAEDQVAQSFYFKASGVSPEFKEMSSNYVKDFVVNAERIVFNADVDDLENSESAKGSIEMPITIRTPKGKNEYEHGAHAYIKPYNKNGLGVKLSVDDNKDNSDTKNVERRSLLDLSTEGFRLDSADMKNNGSSDDPIWVYDYAAFIESSLDRPSKKTNINIGASTINIGQTSSDIINLKGTVNVNGDPIGGSTPEPQDINWNRVSAPSINMESTEQSITIKARKSFDIKTSDDSFSSSSIESANFLTIKGNPIKFHPRRDGMNVFGEGIVFKSGVGTPEGHVAALGMEGSIHNPGDSGKSAFSLRQVQDYRESGDSHGAYAGESSRAMGMYSFGYKDELITRHEETSPGGTPYSDSSIRTFVVCKLPASQDSLAQKARQYAMHSIHSLSLGLESKVREDDPQGDSLRPGYSELVSQTMFKGAYYTGSNTIYTNRAGIRVASDSIYSNDIPGNHVPHVEIKAEAISGETTPGGIRPFVYLDSTDVNIGTKIADRVEIGSSGATGVHLTSVLGQVNLWHGGLAEIRGTEAELRAVNLDAYKTSLRAKAGGLNIEIDTPVDDGEISVNKIRDISLNTDEAMAEKDVVITSSTFKSFQGVNVGRSSITLGRQVTRSGNTFIHANTTDKDVSLYLYGPISHPNGRYCSFLSFSSLISDRFAMRKGGPEKSYPTRRSILMEDSSVQYALDRSTWVNSASKHVEYWTGDMLDVVLDLDIRRDLENTAFLPKTGSTATTLAPSHARRVTVIRPQTENLYDIRIRLSISPGIVDLSRVSGGMYYIGYSFSLCDLAYPLTAEEAPSPAAQKEAGVTNIYPFFGQGFSYPHIEEDHDVEYVLNIRYPGGVYTGGSHPENHEIEVSFLYDNSKNFGKLRNGEWGQRRIPLLAVFAYEAPNAGAIGTGNIPTIQSGSITVTIVD